MSQGFTNIIENSVQHFDGNTICILCDSPGDQLNCVIEGDGKGIPDEDKDKIFDKGFTTDEKRETGLGMFLVETLLDIYGQDIEVKDSELGGVRFDITLKKA